MQASGRTRREAARCLAGIGLWLVSGAVLAACGYLPVTAPPRPKLWRIGLFHVGIDHVPPSLDGLRDGLKALGYEEGRTVELDWRNLVDEDAATATAQEFVRQRVDLIVAFENQTVRAAKAATTQIPIVFLHVTDPVGNHIIDSFAHPGGNLTGFTGWPDLPGKKLELFKEIAPSVRRLLMLTDPRDPVARASLLAARQAAVLLELELVEQEVTTRADLEQVFGSLADGAADGVISISPDLQTNYGSLIIRLATGKGLPVASNRKEWVERGALWSYGPDNAATGRASARVVDKILKGARPADIPVEQSDILQLVINLKVAESLGLAIPQSALGQAAEVIQ